MGNHSQEFMRVIDGPDPHWASKVEDVNQIEGMEQNELTRYKLSAVELSSTPLIAKILKNYLPFNQEKKSNEFKHVAKLIRDYLFNQESLTSEEIEEQLGEDCYLDLRGLKVMLRKTEKLKNVEESIQEHKRLVGGFLEEILQDESKES